MDILKKMKNTFSLGSAGTNGNGSIHQNNIFKLLIDNSNSALAYISSNSRFEFVNKAYANWFGLNPEEIIGQSVSGFFGTETFNFLYPYIEKATNGKEVHFTNEVVFKNSNRVIEERYIPDIDELGNMKGYMVFINDLTEKKKTEKELSRKQVELQDYVENAAIGLHWINSRGIIIWANKAELAMLGYSAEEYIGHHISEFHNNEEAINDILARLACNETITHYEAELKCRDGTLRIVLISSNVFWEEGKFIHTRCFTVDITEQKKLHKELHERNANYRQLLEGLPVAVYTCDIKGRVNLYNRAAVDLWGRKPEIGKDLWCGSWKIFEADGITPLSLDQCPMAITLKEGRAVKGAEIIIECPDGTRKNVLPNPIPLFDTSGKMTGAVNMPVDITGKKIVEQELTALAAIVESSADAIIGKTLDGIITSWNKAAEKTFGYKASEMIGQSITKLIPADRLNEEPKIIERIKRGESIDHFESKRQTKDGKLIDISLTISPIKDNNGKVVGASKISRDITIQKQLNEELRKSEERLRMASEAARLGTWEYHPFTKKLVWSDECKNIYGLASDIEVDNDFVAAHILPEDREYVHQEVTKAYDPNGNGNLQIIHRIIRESDQKVRWLKVNGKVFFDTQQLPDKFIGTMLDITEEKEAEQIIRESEERLRMAVESTKLGTWEYHPLTGELKWSEECRKIYDVPGNIEVDFQFFTDHIYPDDAAYAQHAIQQAMEPSGNGHYDIQYRILRYSDQQPIWIRAQGKVYFNNQKLPERFIGTVLDITEEKTQEQQLKDSVELFTTMADNVPAMIWMSGTDKYGDYFNNTWLSFTGRTLEQESNEGWLSSVHPDDVKKCVDNYTTSFREQKGSYTEYRLKRFDGQYRWIADSSVPRYDTDGYFTGFISACIDIDDQKRFREKIQASELLFKTISNVSPVGLWMTDTNAQNVFVNETWMQWTGIPFEKQLGTGWLDRVLEEDKVDVPAKFGECMQKREKYSCEFRILRPDGEIRRCLTEGSPYYDITGQFAGYAGSVTDITEIKKLEERKDDFIKMASHELKTPITSIKGYVQLLMNIYNDLDNEKLQLSKPTIKLSLSTISKQVTKLTRLISELLDLSRVESGKLDLHKTHFNLAAMVEEAAEDVRQTASRHAIIVQNDFEGNIYADKDRLSQVLLNLLTNAIKYSPDANSVEVHLEGNDKYATIRIKDYGIGIDKKDHQKIFERFYRVEGKNEQTFPGFGIGLFIASEIIARHQGTISVESEKYKGAVFNIMIPVTPVKHNNE